MAERPDGKPAGVERVVFTRPAADRIAKAVRIVEAGNRDAEGFGQGVRLQSLAGQRVFRMGTFSGSWDIGTQKTVTFRNQTTTANVTNLLINLPQQDGERSCAVGKDGTAWYLINWQWDVVDAATAATLTTAALRFDTLPFGALATASTVTFSVPITTCATATSS